MLTWSELEGVLLDVEVKLNNRPISEEEEVSDNWKKQQRYVHKFKEAAWKRWVHKYLPALRET